MTPEERARKAKVVLQNGGVKVYQKDIKEVTIFKLPTPEDIDFCHREIVQVEMKDGRIYEAIQETVDHAGKFSGTSAKWETKEVKEV